MDLQGLAEFVKTKEGALNVIEQLRGGAKTRWPYHLIRNYLSVVVPNGIYQSYSIPTALELIRARPLEESGKWPFAEHQLGSRKPEDTKKFGRCHRPDHPVGYCSLYEDIALSEISAESGKCYAVSTFMLPKGAIVIPVGEFDYYRRTGETYIGHAVRKSTKAYESVRRGENWVVSALIDAFVADEFLRPAEIETDYKLTSAFCDVLLNDLPKSRPIDAIVYPSVAFRAGLNFAVPWESWQSNMKLVDARIIEITEVVGYGIFDWRQIAKLRSVGSGGDLEWEASDSGGADGMFAPGSRRFGRHGDVRRQSANIKRVARSRANVRRSVR